MKKNLRTILIISILIQDLLILNLSIYSQFPLTSKSLLNYDFKTPKNFELSTKTLKSISTSSNDETEPAIIIDSTDVIHLVWSSYDIQSHNQSIMYANSSDNFLNIQRISNLSSNNKNPCITVDSLNIVHIAWVGFNKLIYTNSSVNYSFYINITDESNINEPQITCDSSGLIHLVWSEYKNSNWDIFYVNSSTSFSNIKKISSNIMDDESPALCVKNGIVYITWEKEASNYEYVIAYKNSSDDFDYEKIISHGGLSSYSPRIAIDSNDIIHIVWNMEKYIQYDPKEVEILIFLYFFLPYFNDCPYCPPERVMPFYIAYFFPSFMLYFAFDYDIYYSNSSNDFQSQIFISELLNEDDFSPDIVVDSNNICHIMWFIGKQLHNRALIYTNSSLNYQEFKWSSFYGYDYYPRIANDTKNEIHCVFVSRINRYDIFYLNSSDLQKWDIILPEPRMRLDQFITAIPTMPNFSIFTVFIIFILIGINLFTIFIHNHIKESSLKNSNEK